MCSEMQRRRLQQPEVLKITSDLRLLFRGRSSEVAGCARSQRRADGEVEAWWQHV